MDINANIDGIRYGLWINADVFGSGRWCYSATVFPDLYRQGIVLRLETVDINEAYQWKLKMEGLGNNVAYEVKEVRGVL